MDEEDLDSTPWLWTGLGREDVVEEVKEPEPVWEVERDEELVGESVISWSFVLLKGG